jgi:hypothetical protein
MLELLVTNSKVVIGAIESIRSQCRVDLSVSLENIQTGTSANLV